MASRADRGDPHRVVGPVEAAGAHPPAVAGRPAAGIPHVEAALDVEVPGAFSPAHVGSRPWEDCAASTISSNASSTSGPSTGASSTTAGAWTAATPSSWRPCTTPTAPTTTARFKGLGSRLRHLRDHAAARALRGHAAHHRQHDHRLRGLTTSRTSRATCARATCGAGEDGGAGAGDVRWSLRRPLRTPGRGVEDRPTAGRPRMEQGGAGRPSPSRRTVHGRASAVPGTSSTTGSPGATAADLTSRAGGRLGQHRPHAVGRPPRGLVGRSGPQLGRAHLDRDRRLHADVRRAGGRSRSRRTRPRPAGHGRRGSRCSSRRWSACSESVVHLHGHDALGGQRPDLLLVVGPPGVVPDVDAATGVRAVGGVDQHLGVGGIARRR